MRKLVAKTLVWLHERPHEAGTEFVVVDAPDPAAEKPVQIDPTTARLWIREKRAGELADIPPARKPRG